MPSIFARSRTSSAKKLPPTPLPELSATDEFGRVLPRQRQQKDRRQRTHNSSDYRREPEVPPPQFEDGYLPTSLGPEETPQQFYGYLSHAKHVVLSLEDVTKLVDIVAGELASRGLTTPFLFCNNALDISPSSIRRLINAFLSGRSFQEECQFAGPHDLGMLLRWGLARVVRVVNGHEMRGLISWETYLAWRSAEQASNYARTEFSRFVPMLPPPVQPLILSLFTLFTRLVAHSTSSGLTPLALSSLFGPLLFGLDHSLAFHHSYAAYLRGAHATEHLIVSFICLQDAQATGSTPLPSRLKGWIKGYPSMLAPNDRLEKARRGVRTLRLCSIRRNVRMYSPDLVRSCASWAREAAASGHHDFISSKTWQQITPASQSPNLPSLPPRYSDAFRKKMDLPQSFQPDVGHGSGGSLSASSSTTSTTSTISTISDDKEFGVGVREGEDRFRSLTDLKWGNFEELGFGDADNKKLQFDLTESARSNRNVKRSTLSWQDFSSSGFLRNELSLSTTLQFSAPLAHTVTEWPAQAADMQRKLKKAQKTLPAFGWDTAPVVASEELMEEGFLDVFCDIIYGGGWLDRSELTFRDCNWALVDFKSLPTSNVQLSSSSTTDPRSATTLLLFEEFVPSEYRMKLQSDGSSPSIRKRLPSLFTPGKNKNWKPAPTLNGRPYVVGSVPRSPTAREVEFEGLLRSGAGVTKIITLDQASRSQSQLKVANVAGKNSGDSTRPNPSDYVNKPLPSSLAFPIRSPVKEKHLLPQTPARRAGHSDSPTTTPSGKKSRFRLGGRHHVHLTPAEYDTVDFETRLASYSDDELNSSARNSRDGDRDGRRMSKDDAWVDIMVASRKLGELEREMERESSRMDDLKPPKIRVGKADPELASLEIAQALAGIKQHPHTDDEGDGDADVESRLSPYLVRSRNHSRERERDIESDARSALSSALSTRLDDDDDGSISVISNRPPLRTLGYFDKHPERRRNLLPSELTPSPPDTASISAVGRLTEPQNNVADMFSAPEPSAPGVPAHHSFFSERSGYSQAGTSVTSDEEGDDEEEQEPDVEVPAFVHEPRLVPPKTSPMPSTPLPVTGTHTAQPLTPSKTASLIELYREKEKTGTLQPFASSLLTQPNPSSRIPVRAKERDPLLPTLAVSTSTSPTPTPQTLPTPTPPVDVGSFDPPPMLFVDMGRSSPHRYVHGAPLHNVLEEGEEED